MQGGSSSWRGRGSLHLRLPSPELVQVARTDQAPARRYSGPGLSLEIGYHLRVKLQDLTEIRSGYQAREGLQTTSDGTHYIVQAKDIEESYHSLIIDSLDKIVPTRDPQPYEIKNGDVLFLSRGNKRYATLVEHLPENLPSLALYYFFILRTREGLVDPAFLVWLLNEAESQDYLGRAGAGTTIPFVKRDTLSLLEFRLPPLREQIEIGRLHRLAYRESWLLRQLECKRSELARVVCRQLYERETA
jgi:hypothetical protein